MQVHVDSQMISNQQAFSVEQFCEAHGNISRAFFYKLVASGRGPRLMNVGRRVLISEEAAADWRREMEERTAVQAPTQVTAYRTEATAHAQAAHSPSCMPVDPAKDRDADVSIVLEAGSTQ
jgi:hypothetical protein